MADKLVLDEKSKIEFSIEIKKKMIKKIRKKIAAFDYLFLDWNKKNSFDYWKKYLISFMYSKNISEIEKKEIMDIKNKKDFEKKINHVRSMHIDLIKKLEKIDKPDWFISMQDFETVFLFENFRKRG